MGRERVMVVFDSTTHPDEFRWSDHLHPTHNPHEIPGEAWSGEYTSPRWWHHSVNWDAVAIGMALMSAVASVAVVVLLAYQMGLAQ